MGEGMKMIIDSLFSKSYIVVVDNAKDLLNQLGINKSLILDIVFIDVGLSDFITPQRLRKLSPETKVCLLDAESDFKKNAQHYRDGFNGLLLTSSTTNAMQDTVSSLLLGQCAFPGGVNVHTRKPNTKESKELPITFRQQEILSLMSLGLSNKEIASHYSLTESTVKRHMSNIFKKLGVQNRVEAAKIASERKLLFN